MATPEPRYQVELKDGPFEVRRYAPRVVAETRVDGGLREAGNRGFRRLAGYIFGGNHGRVKVAMTAPVGARAAGGGWVIAFTMPAAHTLDTLPAPADPTVALRRAGELRVAVLRGRGRWTEARFAALEARLRGWITKNGLRAVGDAELERYDPPWTLPPLRRNEVWIEVVDAVA